GCWGNRNDLASLLRGAHQPARSGLIMEPTAPVSPRSETFGYTCRRCSLCCYHKAIQVNPYEVAHLAKRLGETTGEFRERWTVDGIGTLLKQRENGACVFLGSDGCTLYSVRP